MGNHYPAVSPVKLLVPQVFLLSQKVGAGFHDDRRTVVGSQFCCTLAVIS